jgi:hypothetical protein
MAKGGKSTAQQVLQKTKELVSEYAKVGAGRPGAGSSAGPLLQCEPMAPSDGSPLLRAAAGGPERETLNQLALSAAARHPLRLHPGGHPRGTAGHQAQAQHLAAAGALRLSSGPPTCQQTEMALCDAAKPISGSLGP